MAYTQEDFDQAIFDLRRFKQKALWKSMCPSGREVAEALRTMEENTPLKSAPVFCGAYPVEVTNSTPIIAGFVYYHPHNAQMPGGPVYIERPGASVPIHLELDIPSIFSAPSR